MASFTPPPAAYLPPEPNYVNIIFISNATAAKPSYPAGMTPASEEDTKFLTGTDNYPLNEQGKREAQALSDAINASGLIFERIYCSSLQKSQETAQPLSLSRNLTPIVDPRLNEISKGAIQSSFKGVYQANETYKKYKAMKLEEQYFSPMGEGGETKADSTQKIADFLNEIRADKSLSGKTIVVFTHGTPLKALYTLSMEENREAMEHADELQTHLKKFLPLDDPKKCEAVQYQLNMDKPELRFNAKLHFADGTIETQSYPRLKS